MTCRGWSPDCDRARTAPGGRPSAQLEQEPESATPLMPAPTTTTSNVAVKSRSAACGLARRAGAVARAVYAAERALRHRQPRPSRLPGCEVPLRRRGSRAWARYASLTPVRRASSRITWSDGIRSPLSMREMYAALQPKASSRWLRPAPTCLVKPLPDSDWVVVVRDAGTFVRHHHTKDSNACSWQRKATRLTRWTEAR